MTRLLTLASLLLFFSSSALAADAIVSGRVQRVILQPSGTDDCPPPCPPPPAHADGLQTVCISNGGGCQSMEVEVDHVYSGEAGEAGKRRRLFKTRIGEWGPTFSATSQQIVVSQTRNSVTWSPVTLRDGRAFVDPQRLRSMAAAHVPGQHELVALDEWLALDAPVASPAPR